MPDLAGSKYSQLNYLHREITDDFPNAILDKTKVINVSLYECTWDTFSKCQLKLKALPRHEPTTNGLKVRNGNM